MVFFGTTDRKGTSKEHILSASCVVLDIDDDTIGYEVAGQVQQAFMSKGYWCVAQHTSTNNRFRVVIPLIHPLEQHANLYNQFGNLLSQWFPELHASLDPACTDIGRRFFYGKA
jgi:hypothetical protein